MSIFQELDQYLNQDFSDDYWYDDANLHACNLVKQLTPSDWIALKSSWQDRSQGWQERCAEILDWGDTNESVPLLIEMLQQKNDELTLAAADSLRSIGIAHLNVRLEKDTLKRLQELAQTGRVSQLIVEALLDQLLSPLPSAKDSLRQGWEEALDGRTIPLSELWEGVESEGNEG